MDPLTEKQLEFLLCNGVQLHTMVKCRLFATFATQWETLNRFQHNTGASVFPTIASGTVRTANFTLWIPILGICGIVVSGRIYAIEKGCCCCLALIHP